MAHLQDRHSGIHDVPAALQFCERLFRIGEMFRFSDDLAVKPDDRVGSDDDPLARHSGDADKPRILTTFNEPISDCLRATLDGHIVLSRELAHQAHYPAIDVLKSSSRVMDGLIPDAERDTVHRTRATLALLARHRQMIEIGAYDAGSNAGLDRAIGLEPALRDFLCQGREVLPRDAAMRRLQAIVGNGKDGER